MRKRRVAPKKSTARGSNDAAQLFPRPSLAGGLLRPAGAKLRGFASRTEGLRKVREAARAELRSSWPKLTDETFDRFAAMHGPFNEPKAHAHLRAIRAAITAASEHLLEVQRTNECDADMLDGPDRQLLDVLRALDMWGPGSSGSIALDHAERAVRFRAHDLPELRDRRSLVEALLGSIGLRFTPRQFALMSLAIGFGREMTKVEWVGASVEDIICEERKTMTSELRRRQADGSAMVKAQIRKVVAAGKRGRPKKNRD